MSLTKGQEYIPGVDTPTETPQKDDGASCRTSWFWQVQKVNLKPLAYLTNIQNLESILECGLLSHSEVRRRNLLSSDISNPDVQRWRDRCDNPHGRPLHEYVPLYVRPRNPMLYVLRDRREDLCILQVSVSILEDGEFLFSDGNAASADTKFYSDLEDLGKLPWDVLRGGKYWNNFFDGKRKACSEFLIYPSIPAEYIMAIYFYSDSAYKKAKYTVGIPCKISSKLFF